MKSSRSDLVLKSFLLASPKKESLESFLPKKTREALAKLPDLSPQTAPFSEDPLRNVHWSWFLPILQTYSQVEQKLFLSCLDPFSAKNLARALTLSINEEDVTVVAKSYFKRLLLESLLGPKNELLPKRSLPETPLNKLLRLSKKELTKLIDLLSIYDLAKELPQIVDTKILKKIYSLLTEEEKKILKKISGKKDSLLNPKMGLEHWDGLEESLRMQLHKRGLTRLSLAVASCHPDFIWYASHQLDSGRGASLQNSCFKEAGKGKNPTIEKQILELL